MAGTQRLLAIAMVFLLPGNPGNGNADPVGMVLLADKARIGSQSTAEGTTIYDGDRLSTDEEGSLQLRVGEALVYLPDKSCVTLHKGASGTAKEFEAELVSGTMVLSATAGTAAEIVASSARIQPMAETRGVVQGGDCWPARAHRFRAARAGADFLSRRYRNDFGGKSYRVRLNDSDDGTPGEPGTKKSGRHGKALVLIVVGATAAAGVAALWGGGTKGSIESPDRP